MQSIENKNILITIPIFNEVDKIQMVLEKTIHYSNEYADILLVNDGSTDGTFEEIERLCIQYPFVKKIQKEKNFGYGASLITGFEYGIQLNYQYLITMDCDEQHQPEDLIRFVNEPREIDLISGSRYLEQSKSIGIDPPTARVEINARITKKINQKYNWNLTDSFCGFKRYKLSSFINHNFEEKGYASPMELWTFLHYKNLSWKEIPVNRIYITDNRTFGEDLDKKRKRFRYYLKVWKQMEIKYNKSNESRNIPIQ
jgi:glycosyltransferase involved in cell wall biosynthesis